MSTPTPIEKKEEILELIKSSGCTIKQAAELGEVSEKTIRSWIRKKANNAHSSTTEMQRVKKENAFLKEIVVGMLLDKELVKKNNGNG